MVQHIGGSDQVEVDREIMFEVKEEVKQTSDGGGDSGSYRLILRWRNRVIQITHLSPFFLLMDCCVLCTLHQDLSRVNSFTATSASTKTALHSRPDNSANEAYF